MTVDSLNIANGTAGSLVTKHQGKNIFPVNSQRTLSNLSTKPETGKVENNNPVIYKSLKEINHSQTPLNKAVESNQNSLKGMLNADISHKNSIIVNNDNTNTNATIAGTVPVEINQSNPALIEQKGWFITIIPDKRIDGGFLELTEHRDEKKEKLKSFYNPVVNFNKGKLLDIVT